MSRNPPRLLVSVRDASEAALALRGGCDILDVKEPRRGPLGMADPPTMAGIVRVADTSQPAVETSLALGDASDRCVEQLQERLPRVSYVKLGTAGLSGREWGKSWIQARGRIESCLPGNPMWIVVAYADAGEAASPPAAEVVRFASDFGCGGVLIDTWAKNGSWLGDHLTTRTLVDLCAESHAKGLLFALAGGLRADRIPRAPDLCPDILGIRGAACQRGDREGRICPEAIAAFRAAYQPGERGQS